MQVFDAILARFWLNCQQSSHLQMQKIKEIWRWRGFVAELVRRDLQSRYAGSTLGVLWHFIQPLMQILIYVIVFSEVMRSRLPGNPDALAYSVFLCAGLLPWQLFADILSRSATMFMDHANLLKKSGFPRICLPISVVLSSLLHFSIVFGFFLLLLLATGRSPGWAGLLAVPMLTLLSLMAFGLGLLVGTLSVFLRDMVQMVGIGTQFLFWLTPIVWPIQAVPASWHHWFAINPLFGLITGLQGIFLGTYQAHLHTLLFPAICVMIVLAVGLIYFRKLSGEVADAL